MTKNEVIIQKSNYPNLYENESRMKSSNPTNVLHETLFDSNDQNQIHERNKKTSDYEQGLVVRIETDSESGMVSLSQLGTVSNGLQRIFTTLLNDLIGKGNINGSIPKVIVDSSQLVVGDISPESFNMHIVNRPDAFINGLFAEENLENMYALFNRITKEDPSFIIEEIGLRTFTVTKHWFDQMDKENISLSIMKDFEEVKVDQKMLDTIIHKFNDIKSKVISEEIEVIGVIDSANRSTTTIKILKEDSTSIRAKADMELFEEGLVIGIKPYKFTLNKILVQSISSNQTKETFKVISIKEFEE